LAWKSARQDTCWSPEKGKVGERYLLGGENLTLKQMLDTLAKITGLPRAHSENSSWARAGCVAYASTAFFADWSGASRAIPVEGVKIARHMIVCGLLARQALNWDFKRGRWPRRSKRAVRLVRSERLHRQEPRQAHGSRRRLGFCSGRSSDRFVFVLYRRPLWRHLRRFDAHPRHIRPSKPNSPLAQAARIQGSAPRMKVRLCNAFRHSRRHSGTMIVEVLLTGYRQCRVWSNLG